VDVAAVETFTAVLALGAAAMGLATLAGRFVRSRSAVVESVMAGVDDAALWLAFLVAAGATAGSLYFSEVADFVPCRLCWFQRVCMYPLSLLLLIAAVRRDRGIRWYALPLAGVGAAISTYHYVIEWKPSLEGGACGVGPASCTTVWFRRFGFVSLPFMALCGFVAIVLLLAGASDAREPGGADQRPPDEPGARRREKVVSP